MQLLTAKKKESIADRFPKHPKMRKAMSEQPIMYASVMRVRFEASVGFRWSLNNAGR